MSDVERILVGSGIFLLMTIIAAILDIYNILRSPIFFFFWGVAAGAIGVAILAAPDAQ